MLKLLAKTLVLSAIGTLAVASAAVAESFEFPAPEAASGNNSGEVVLYSTTDIEAAQPFIAGFQKRHPSISVVYHDLQSIALFERVVAETEQGETTADLVISSALDLQIKLVNDGYAARWKSAEAGSLPSWAIWRNSAFGITYEPAVIVYYKPFFKDRPAPTTRAALARYLEEDGSTFFGKVATYDVERSGLGFLFLARDQEHSADIWRLVSLMGEQGVKLYSSSAAIIDRVASGRFLLGYNILGSYAERMARTRPDLGVINPEDYTIVMSRVALIPRAAKAPGLGGLFLDFLLSVEGQRILATDAGLNAIRSDIEGANTATSLSARLGARARPIRVGPGLLVYLDQTKRRRLIERWNAALVGR
ncbi:MAG: ABC transporter substrate-binding protein [Alphaproteobacteria bacterium]